MNQIEGHIPNAIASLEKLETLKLYSNKLEGTIPAELMQLTNLKVLLLGSNFLTGTIPTEIWALIKLEQLSLIDNKLEGEIPIEIAQLTNLRELVLSSNQFTGKLPMEFVRLTKLNLLMVNDNNLVQDYDDIYVKDKRVNKYKFSKCYGRIRNSQTLKIIFIYQLAFWKSCLFKNHHGELQTTKPTVIARTKAKNLPSLRGRRARQSAKF